MEFDKVKRASKEKIAQIESENSALQKKLEAITRDSSYLGGENQSLRNKCARMKRELTEASKVATQAEANHENERQKLTESIHKAKQGSADQVQAHKNERAVLVQELKEAHDKNFQLQPYEQNISSATARTEYTAVCDGIESWVERHLDPILDNEARFQSTCAAVRQDPNLLTPLWSLMKDTDLVAASFQDTDTQIVIAIIMRFLHRDVLGRNLYGITEQKAAFLGCIGEGMGRLLPKRGKPGVFVLV